MQKDVYRMKRKGDKGAIQKICRKNYEFSKNKDDESFVQYINIINFFFFLSSQKQMSEIKQVQYICCCCFSLEQKCGKQSCGMNGMEPF